MRLSVESRKEERCRAEKIEAARGPPREHAHGGERAGGAGALPGGRHCQLQEMRGLGGEQRHGRALLEEEIVVVSVMAQKALPTEIQGS